MRLIGVNRSPYTRRVAITLKLYGVPFEQSELSGFGNRQEVLAVNPLGRIPALVLDDGETLIDSGAIVDHLDETYGGEQPLTPRSGVERRCVLRVVGMMVGACEKGLQTDVTAFVAERLARASCRIDTGTEMPKLRALSARLLEMPAFRSTEP